MKKMIFVTYFFLLIWTLSFNLIFAITDEEYCNTLTCPTGTVEGGGSCGDGYKLSGSSSQVSTVSWCKLTCYDCVELTADEVYCNTLTCPTGTVEGGGSCEDGYKLSGSSSQVSTVSWCPLTCYGCEKIITETKCDSSCTSGSNCQRTSAFTSTTSDCKTPTSSPTFTTDCSCNFDASASNCIKNCKCATCKSVSFTNDTCGANINNPPYLVSGSFKVKNHKSEEVYPEDGNKNHICQDAFDGVRKVTFTIKAKDSENDEITSASLSWNGTPVPLIIDDSSTNTYIFGWSAIDIPVNLNGGNTYPLLLTLSDRFGTSSSLKLLDLKIWDCQVSVSGAIYDATDSIKPFCPSNGFIEFTDPDVLNFTSLFYDEDGGNIEMSVNPDRVSYNSSSNYLIWGKRYHPRFNDEISLEDWEMRYKTNMCDDGELDTGLLDAYSVSVDVTADFSGVLIQDPWWQTINGGVMSNNKVIGQIPATCLEEKSCTPKISDNAFVIAPEIEKKSNQDKYFSPSSSTIANSSNNYEYFYKQYYAKKGIGKIVSNPEGKVIINNLSDLGENLTGIYFINGNLEINGNIEKTLPFLMLIVKGDVIVNDSTEIVEGLIVANNIFALGESDTKLTFNGSLFSYNNIDFSRDYLTRINNNNNPAVIVEYDPELIFNIPKEIAKVLNSWQWGN